MMHTQLTDVPAGVLTAVATAVGTGGPTGDGAYVHVLQDGTTAACVVDGIGHSERITARSAFLAEVGARIAATRGPLHGILTAAEMIADPGPDSCPEEDAVAVAVVARPGREVTVGWTGDCAAWSYDPVTDEVVRLTSDHTMGSFLRTVHPGGPATRAEHHDDWVRVSLARSSVASVRESEASEGVRLVVLASDGLHGAIGEDRLVRLIRNHGAPGSTEHPPSRIADSLVGSALACAATRGGTRDDVTVIVLAWPDR
ncbi:MULTISPECIES: hypothetical protein [unclassified Kitasatospora]|uniref:hypothetical protein n=1 Tax=unclassified Kitasatospora TaxID=2633591 RepID=UPI003830D4F6